MFCRRCGAEIPDGSAFCNRCGATQAEPAAVTEPQTPANPVGPAEPQTPAPKKANKTVLLGIGIATLLLAGLIVWLGVFPFGVDTGRHEPTPLVQRTPTPTHAPNKAATDAPTPTRKVTPTKAPTATPTEAPDYQPFDDGYLFMMDQQILTVDERLFGLTFEELNNILDVPLPAKMAWEWSSVPLEYLGYTYSDGNVYILYFEKNRLIGVRTEDVISENAFPQALLNKILEHFGDGYTYWYYKDNGKTFEYNWKVKIKGKTGEYAFFLNPYDNINHICQQLTSADYTGGSIQSH